MKCYMFSLCLFLYILAFCDFGVDARSFHRRKLQKKQVQPSADDSGSQDQNDAKTTPDPANAPASADADQSAQDGDASGQDSSDAASQAPSQPVGASSQDDDTTPAAPPATTAAPEAPGCDDDDDSNSSTTTPAGPVIYYVPLTTPAGSGASSDQGNSPQGMAPSQKQQAGDSQYPAQDQVQTTTTPAPADQDQQGENSSKHDIESSAGSRHTSRANTRHRKHHHQTVDHSGKTHQSRSFSKTHAKALRSHHKTDGDSGRRGIVTTHNVNRISQSPNAPASQHASSETSSVVRIKNA